jgi:tRNA U34 2-thiouridine synthase MnmA/TrmU
MHDKNTYRDWQLRHQNHNVQLLPVKIQVGHQQQNGIITAELHRHFDTVVKIQANSFGVTKNQARLVQDRGAVRTFTAIIDQCCQGLDRFVDAQHVFFKDIYMCEYGNAAAMMT